MNTHESKKYLFLKNLFVETYIKDIVDRNNLSETEEMQKTCKYNCFFYMFVNKSQ